MKQESLPPRKHRYIPVFYLKQWTASDGHFVEFRREHGRVVVKRAHPKATGFQSHLNSEPRLPTPACDYLEQEFFRLVDDLAAKAHAQITKEKATFAADHKNNWTRFIVALGRRNPQALTDIKNEFDQDIENLIETKYRSISAMETHDAGDIEQVVANIQDIIAPLARIELIQRLCDSPKIGENLVNMIWTKAPIIGSRNHFVISDRPIIRSGSLLKADSYLAMPLKPDQLLVLTNTPEQAHRFTTLINDPQVIEFINSILIKQANQSVWDADRSLEPCIRNKMRG